MGRDSEFNAASGLHEAAALQRREVTGTFPALPSQPAGMSYHKVRHCARTGMRIETDVEVREDCEPRVTEHITMSADTVVGMRRKS
jgi:hypothetical protein